MRTRRLGARLLAGYWFLPTGTVVLAGGLAVALLELDEHLAGSGRRVGFSGGPDSARELLSSIASSTLTLTALVFSVTIVVLQLASSQFSPRVLRTFLRDPRNQVTLGVFLATFVFALLVLRKVRGGDGGPNQFVPSVAVAVSFALVLLSVAFFVQYIHTIGQSIRVIHIIDRISTETIAAIDRVHPAGRLGPDDVLPSAAPRRVVEAAKRGVVTSVDLEQLKRAAEAADVTITVLPRPGDFVACGMPLVAVCGNGHTDDRHVRAAIALDKERDPAEDPAFGFRQLIDIAERALSPGVNDPTTATQCLDHLHDLLRRMATRALVDRTARDAAGTIRVVAPQPCWDDYVRLALDEVRHWGAGSLQVQHRIGSIIEDLMTVASPGRTEVLNEQRRLLQARRADLPTAEHATVGRLEA